MTFIGGRLIDSSGVGFVFADCISSIYNYITCTASHQHGKIPVFSLKIQTTWSRLAHSSKHPHSGLVEQPVQQVTVMEYKVLHS